MLVSGVYRTEGKPMIYHGALPSFFVAEENRIETFEFRHQTNPIQPLSRENSARREKRTFAIQPGFIPAEKKKDRRRKRGIDNPHPSQPSRHVLVKLLKKMNV
jgi:hypothetical protein